MANKTPCRYQFRQLVDIHIAVDVDVCVLHDVVTMMTMMKKNHTPTALWSFLIKLREANFRHLNETPSSGQNVE